VRTTKASNLLSHPFRDEAIAWLCTRRGEISTTTYQTYLVHVGSLERFFKERKLRDIRAKDVRAYQKFRMGIVGASIINKELSVLQQMLDHAGHWAGIRGHYRGVITSADGITPRLRRRQSRTASPLPSPTTRRKSELAVSAQPAMGQSPVTVSCSGTKIAPRRGPLGIAGFRNVTLRASGKFRASVMVNRKRIVLGEWDTAAAAAAAAKEYRDGNSSYRRVEAARDHAMSVLDALTRRT
jgi:hypothetical protein